MLGKDPMQAPESFHLLSIAQLCLSYRTGQDGRGLVVGLAVYGIGDTVLAAVGEAVAGGVVEAGSNSPYQLGYKAEGADGFGPHALHPQQILKAFRLALIGGEEYLLEVFRVKVMQ